MADEAMLKDGRFIAALDMLGRFGAREVQIRYSDDEEPTLWMVAVKLFVDANDKPVATLAEADRTHWDCAAGMNPLRAALRLCEALGDGGVCAHCGNPSGISEDFDAMPFDALVCWYQYDPELKTFRRGCEGDDK